jgi:hypothetical protein
MGLVDPSGLSDPAKASCPGLEKGEANSSVSSGFPHTKKFLQGADIIGVGCEFETVNPSSSQSFTELLTVCPARSGIFLPEISTGSIDEDFFTGFSIFKLNDAYVWYFQLARVVDTSANQVMLATSGSQFLEKQIFKRFFRRFIFWNDEIGKEKNNRPSPHYTVDESQPLVQVRPLALIGMKKNFSKNS